MSGSPPSTAGFRRPAGIASGRFQDEERQVGQASIALGTKTDSYELEFADELKVHTQVLAVGRDSSGSQVQIAYAIAGSGLEPVTVTQGYLYSVRVRFVALDRLGKVAAALDTTRHFVAPAPVPSDEHLVGRVALKVPAGQLTYRLALQQGEESGVVLSRDTVRVGQPTSTALGLSDLVLGSRSTNLYWRRTDKDTVMFNPLRTFKRNEEMELYYEMEGLSSGTPYAVRIAVRKQGGGGGIFRRSSVVAGQPSASSSTSRPHSPSPAASEPQARPPQARQLHAGVLSWMTGGAAPTGGRPISRS